MGEQGRKVLALLAIGICMIIASASAEERKLKIYVYPEDPVVIAHHEFHDLNSTFYGLDVVFYRLLNESSYLVANPAEADFFYLPIYLYWQKNRMTPTEVAAYLKKVGPWFDRKNGSDHIFVWTGDFARCEWGFWDSLRKSILIHHFGKVYNGGVPSVNPCDPLKGWGDECDPMIGQFKRIREHGFRKGYQPCHYMGQDIVVPPAPWENNLKTRYLDPSYNLTRTDLAFFAGPVNINHDRPEYKEEPWHDAMYSFGARQMFKKIMGNVSGVQIFEKHVPNYHEQLSKAKFCLAAAGWGWGGRMKFALMHGCIPIIVQDGIKVEFEEQVPLKDYALRIPMWLIHKLPEILDSLIKRGVPDKMFKALECTWRLHRWSRPQGRAFDLVMCELQKRLRGGEIKVDTAACTIQCGDGAAVQRIQEHFP